MKLTITIEDEQETEARVERGSASLDRSEEHPTEGAATSAGSPPEWLLQELGGHAQTQAEEMSEARALAADAGPAAATMNGASLMRA